MSPTLVIVICIRAQHHRYRLLIMISMVNSTFTSSLKHNVHKIISTEPIGLGVGGEGGRH